MKLPKILVSVLLAISAGMAIGARDAKDARGAWIAWQPAGSVTSGGTNPADALLSGNLPSGNLSIGTLSNDTLQVHRLEGTAKLPPRVSIGSTWKLFVFAYLSGTNASESQYRCTAANDGRNAGGVSIVGRSNGDEYCCDPGESIDRNTALARSCGNYFETTRLKISGSDWQRYWREREAPGWLHQLENLRPDQQLAVPEVLAGLKSIAPAARQSARVALAPVSLNGANGTVLAALGSGTRFKTFTWDHPQIVGASLGGAAGWLADGTPFWLGGQGTSRTVLNRVSMQAARVLPRPDKTSASEPCVHVDFLTRYPVREVIDAEHRAPVLTQSRTQTPRLAFADAVVLTRRYVLQLENGKVMTMNAAPAAGEIVLERDTSAPSAQRLRLSGRFSMNEYIGRVIDREADAQHTQAAQALAVAARTYLIQNARFEAGCFRIADDSRTQRVSINPASRSARAAALATDELILEGSTVRYHQNQASPGVMSWQAAVQESDRGRDFTAILKDHWPDAQLGVLGAASQCKPLVQAQSFIAEASVRWQRRLAREPGFEMPQQLRVCQLDFGNPYADLRRSSIYVRQWQSREARITLAHEFIHLAFARHPNGSDERFAEHWARILIDALPTSQLPTSQLSANAQ